MMFARTFVWLIGFWLAVSCTAGDVVVVCPEPWHGSIEPWLSYRRSQGMTLHLLSSKAQAAEVVADIRALIQPGVIRPQAIVLIGDCVVRGSGWPTDPQRHVPTFHLNSPVAASLGSLPTLATDSLYGDLNGDAVCDVPVGRIPIGHPKQIESFVSRLRQYESSSDWGPWRHTLDLTAGVGGFGVLVDTLIESVARNLITSNLPSFVQTRVCYASPSSPYFPGYDAFCDVVQESFNEGGLFWVYAGHGHVKQLDQVPPRASGCPILEKQSVQRLACPPSRAPIALLLACYSGAFDANEECLAETMVLHKGGPIAVIAGSRMTLPYGNAKLAAAMIHAWFDDQPTTLGEMWLQTIVRTNRQEVVDPNQPPAMIDALASMASPTADRLPEERREHTRLYNLLGDPLMRLRHLHRLSLDCPRQATPGQRVHVHGMAPRAGRLVIELHRHGEAPRPSGESQDLRSNHRRASRSLIERQAIEVSQGGFDVIVPLPEGATGSFNVLTRLETEEQCWIGDSRVLVHRPSSEP